MSVLRHRPTPPRRLVGAVLVTVLGGLPSLRASSRRAAVRPVPRHVRRPPWRTRAASAATRSRARTASRARRPSEWDIDGAGDARIQGFATDISVNVGQPHRLQDRHRRDGLLRSTSTGSATTAATAPGRSPAHARRPRLPQHQPQLHHRRDDRALRLRQLGGLGLLGRAVDRGLRRLLRPAQARRANGDDEPHHRSSSATTPATPTCVFQTSDTDLAGLQHRTAAPTSTRAAANGPRLQAQLQPARSRPATAPSGRDFFFANEYPMVRFLERNGYDVSYIAGVDTDRRGNLLKNHKAFLSVGHDEYWSRRAARQRRGGPGRRA